MGESLVGFGHAVRVLFLLHGVAAIIRSVHDFASQTVCHGLFAAPSGVRDDPANRQRAAPLLRDFYGNLVVRAADAPGFHLDRWPHVVNRALEDFQRLFARLLGDLRQRVVENAFGCGLLTAPHDAVDELRHQRAVVNRVRQNLASLCNSSSWHKFSFQFLVFSFQLVCNQLEPSALSENLKLKTENCYFLAPAAPAFGRFAPYLERPCLRSATPTESSVPRMT